MKELLPNDKSPTKKEYDVSKPLLLDQIATYSPKKIVMFGSPIRKHFFNDTSDFKKVMYSQREYDSIPILLSEHPGYIHRLKTSIRKERIHTLADFLR